VSPSVAVPTGAIDAMDAELHAVAQDATALSSSHASLVNESMSRVDRSLSDLLVSVAPPPRTPGDAKAFNTVSRHNRVEMVVPSSPSQG